MTVDMKALKEAAEWATKEEGDFIDALRSSQAFRALANPSTILSLIERCEAMEKALRKAKAEFHVTMDSRDAWHVLQTDVLDDIDAALSKADATP